MLLHQRILRILFPDQERERMHFREWLARANAEAEDLNRMLQNEGPAIIEVVKKYKNGNGHG